MGAKAELMIEDYSKAAELYRYFFKLIDKNTYHRP